MSIKELHCTVQNRNTFAKLIRINKRLSNLYVCNSLINVVFAGNINIHNIFPIYCTSVIKVFTSLKDVSKEIYQSGRET